MVEEFFKRFENTYKKNKFQKWGTLTVFLRIVSVEIIFFIEFGLMYCGDFSREEPFKGGKYSQKYHVRILIKAMEPFNVSSS